MYKNAHLYTVMLKKSKWRTMINFFFGKSLKTVILIHMHTCTYTEKPKGLTLQTIHSLALGVQPGGWQAQRTLLSNICLTYFLFTFLREFYIVIRNANLEKLLTSMRTLVQRHCGWKGTCCVFIGCYCPGRTNHNPICLHGDNVCIKDASRHRDEAGEVRIITSISPWGYSPRESS